MEGGYDSIHHINQIVVCAMEVNKVWQRMRVLGEWGVLIYNIGCPKFFMEIPSDPDLP